MLSFVVARRVISALSVAKALRGLSWGLAGADPFVALQGADWSSLRHIEPPFVPRLQSMTDTSYFPTDDLGELCLVTFTKGPVFTIILGNVPDALPKDAGVGAEKDLAFLG